MSNILTMSDADFLANIDNLPAAVVVEPTAEELAAQQAESERLAAEQAEAATNDDQAAADEAARLQAEADAAAAAAANADTGGEDAAALAAAAAAAEVVTPPATGEIDYKAAYEQIIGRPIKAGGKEIVINTVEEAIQLAQMGVGFHQNSSKLAQHRRIIETLKEHGLLDESKINELIDISNKNPEAIAALVRSAGIEPHQLIPQGDAQPYTPGQHVLPEAQVLFRTSVDNIREQGGTEFLTHVAQDWDVTSRAEVFKDPRALDLLYSHKQDGTYDKISSEVERRKVFDPSMANLPFIHAYLAVGQDMHEKGSLASQQVETQTPAAVVTPVPVVVKPAVAVQPVTPNPAAAKAASVRSTPAPASATPNYLTMPDAEFKAQHMT